MKKFILAILIAPKNVEAKENNKYRQENIIEQVECYQKIEVDNNGNQTILLKDINGYSTEFNASSNANYTFSILYYYKVSSIKVESKTYDQTFNYEHIVNVVTPNPSTPPAKAEKNCNNSAFIVFSSFLASAFVVLIRSRKNR